MGGYNGRKGKTNRGKTLKTGWSRSAGGRNEPGISGGKGLPIAAKKRKGAKSGVLHGGSGVVTNERGDKRGLPIFEEKPSSTGH